MKILCKHIQQTYKNEVWGWMLATYNPIRCVNTCQPVFVRVRISTQRRVDSRFHKTMAAVLKIWSCPIFKQQNQTVKKKVSI